MTIRKKAVGDKRGKVMVQNRLPGEAPSLHYEFRVNGVHRDPLTVKLPKALRIPDSQLARFKLQTAPLLAMLDNKTGTKFAAAPAETTKHMMVALKDSSSDQSPAQ